MNTECGLRLGVDLGGTKIAGIVLDRDDRICAERRIDTPQGDYPGTLAAVAAIVAALEEDAGATVLPVGVGTPGSVSPTSGRMRGCNSTCLNNTRLPRDLAEAVGREIRTANDANCLALSEAFDGAGKDAASLFGVIMGTGVGGSLVIGGRVIDGHNGIAGEWSHNTLPWPSSVEVRSAPRCWCGHDGCIEAWMSGPGMSADHVRRGGHHQSARQIVARAEAGERLAGASLRAWLQRLARSLAMVVNLFDPEVIVVGGGLSQIRWLYSEVPKIWQEHIFSDVVQTRLLPAVHGDASGVRGAARLWPLTINSGLE